MRKQTLLVVDDEADNLDALERIFRKRYHFLRANSAAEALEITTKEPEIDVIITDQRMPMMTGVEFLEKTLSTHPKTVRILLTGFTEIESIIAAVNQGHIFRYITKPWDTADLMNSVDQAMEHYSRGFQLELKNRELENALEELKLLDQAKNKFMILINHELKTPLTVISSFLSLLMETKIDSEQSTYLDRIKKSTNRLQEIIDDTLILTQYTAGKLLVQKQPVNLESIVNSCLSEVQEDAEKKSITFNFKPPISTQQFNLDFALIKRALRHLVNNALRFSPPGSEINLEIDLGNTSAKLMIENEGNPIPQYVIDKLDTPFNLQSEIMNHSKGLGLGLSVSDAIIREHGSRLEIAHRTLPNEKSVVRISFAIS
ncbi:MAG: hypothetical protein RJB66_2170 [Pseudomonadota bacterium]|jgi:signal transduction histidine kinase